MRSLLATAAIFAIAALEVSAKRVNVGYFPNWLYANYPVSKIDFNSYSHILYAFAIANNANGIPIWQDPTQVSTQLPELVSAAHKAGSKVLISIGGWSGCIAYSSIVASASARQAFVNWSIQQITTYKIDGIDLDWEYPGRQGAGCNSFNVANDTPNFLLLLKELHTAMNAKFKGAKKEISLANRAVPFETTNGPSKDVSAFVPYVDRFQLMLYDMNGAWNSTTGPNAPFQQTTGFGAPFSYKDGIDQWLAAGVPPNKLVAGLAYYGHSMTAKTVMTGKSQFQPCVVGNPQGDSNDASWQDPYCPKDPGGFSGIWKWTNLRSQGLLTTPTTAGAGYTRYFDPISQTPWLFNPTSKMFISYEDPQSLQVKIDYAICKNLAGVMVWDVHQDNGELLKVVNGIQGSPSTKCGTIPNPKTVKGTPSPSSSLGKVKTSAAKPITPTTDATSMTPAKTTDSMTTGTDPISTPTDTMTTPTDTMTTPTDTAPAPSGTGTTSSGQCSTSNNGQMVCTAAGKQPGYQQCLNGSWLSLSCPSGTVCTEASGSINCGYPQ